MWIAHSNCDEIFNEKTRKQSFFKYFPIYYTKFYYPQTLMFSLKFVTNIPQNQLKFFITVLTWANWSSKNYIYLYVNVNDSFFIFSKTLYTITFMVIVIKWLFNSISSIGHKHLVITTIIFYRIVKFSVKLKIFELPLLLSLWLYISTHKSLLIIILIIFR